MRQPNEEDAIRAIVPYEAPRAAATPGKTVQEVYDSANETIQNAKKVLEDRVTQNHASFGFKLASMVNWLPNWLHYSGAVVIGASPFVVSVGIAGWSAALSPLNFIITAISSTLLTAAAISGLSAVADIQTVYEEVTKNELIQLGVLSDLLLEFNGIATQLQQTSLRLEHETQTMGEHNRQFELRIIELNTENTRHIALNTTLQQKIDNLTAENSKLSENLHEFNNQNENLKHNTEDLHTNLDKLTQENQTIQTLTKDLQTQLASLANKNTELEHNLHAFTEENTELKQTTATLQTNLDVLSAQNTKVQALAQEQAQQLKILQQENAIAASNLAQLARTKKELDTQVLILTEMVGKITSLSASPELQQAFLNKVSDFINDETKLSAFIGRVEYVEKQLQDRTHELQHLQEKYQTTEKQLEDTADKNKQLLEQLVEELTRLKAMTQLQEKLNAIRSLIEEHPDSDLYKQIDQIIDDVSSAELVVDIDHRIANARAFAFFPTPKTPQTHPTTFTPPPLLH